MRPDRWADAGSRNITSSGRSAKFSQAKEIRALALSALVRPNLEQHIMPGDFSRRRLIGGMLVTSASTLLKGCGPGASPAPAPGSSLTPDSIITPSPSPTPTSSALPTADQMNKNTYDGVLFSTTSPWNTPIPTTARADPNSASMIQNLALAFSNKHAFNVNISSYAVPIFYADATTPRVMVRDSTGWWGGFNLAPIPAQALADPGSDQHMVVWDVPHGLLYEYWHMGKNADSSWSAGFGVKFGATGAGYHTKLWQGSARAYGGSLAGGAIRYREMKKGVIPHALAMAYQYTRGDFYARGLAIDGTRGIASHNDDENDPTRTNGYNIPEGARLRLKRSVDVAARAATLSSAASQRACKIIGRALRTYGAYVVDTAGAPTLYAENLQGKAVSWTDLLDVRDSSPFTASDFEVLTLPALTSAILR